MFFMSAVDEEDKLDRKKAVHVLRRSLEMLRGLSELMVAATVLVMFWTFTVLAGPFLVKYAIDKGIKARRQRARPRRLSLHLRRDRRLLRVPRRRSCSSA